MILSFKNYLFQFLMMIWMDILFQSLHKLRKISLRKKIMIELTILVNQLCIRMEMNFFDKLLCLTIFSEEDFHFNFKSIHKYIFKNKILKSTNISNRRLDRWMRFISFQSNIFKCEVIYIFDLRIELDRRKGKWLSS